ncbi:MAG: NAD(P)-dependent glycerol-3-phosphate dehydrogenase [Deltaproteobacteria bacterium]|nr:NAD(P)-dependent glycerol-3-phosphate dehydrogenase [Deltaproteobacteria bacterium]
MRLQLNQTEFKIGVIGGGSWGTALANLLALKGYKIDLWVFEKDIVEQIKTERLNKLFLPGILLSDNIIPTNNFEKAVSEKDILLIVVPSHFIRNIAGEIQKYVSPQTVILTASKGIENQTSYTMSRVLKEVITKISEKNFAAISGPSFAREVAKKTPTAIVASCCDQSVAKKIQLIFATDYFRVYTNNDLIGTEIGGAIKNVIAIASGMIDGLKLGLNTRAALISRGLAEIRRLGLKMGAKPETFLGLAGAGDLILTCTGNLSRNYILGKRVGEGEKLKEITENSKMIAEGVKNSESVYNLSKRLNIEMPISNAVYHILYKDMAPMDALIKLMTRDLKHEFEQT